MNQALPIQRKRVDLLKELHGYFIEDLEVGQSAFYSRTITEADIVMFAGMSGDFNPLHLNREFSEKTRFGGTIAHGMLTASLISTVVGTRLPGPGAIYLEQTLKFTAPVRPGDTVTAVATIIELNREKRRCRLDTYCTAGDTLVVEGQALLMVSSRNGRG